MSYYHAKILNLPFDAALAAAREALAQQGFGVVTELDIHQTLQAKLGESFRPYTILGACNPRLAYEALQLEDKVGTMLPCNVVVQQGHGQKAGSGDLYGRVREGDFGDGGGRLGLGPESADLVLFPERLHYWMAAGLAEAAFAEAYEALRPGGRLGVIQDRAPSSGAQDPIARDGRVQQAFVVALAGEAGFVLDAAPLIHPRAGQAEGGYERMVLRFRKPMTRGAVLSAQPNVAAPGASL